MELKTLNKRSATFVFRSSQPSSNISSVTTAMNNLSSDIGSIFTEWNTKIKPAFQSLAKGSEDEITGLSSSFDAIRNGIDGLSIFTDRNSDENDNEWIYSTILNRPLTLKESLTEVYQTLSERINTLEVGGLSSNSFDEGAVLFGVGTSAPDFDEANFYWDNTNKRLGIGTNAPLKDLDIRGILSISQGIVSPGGNERGSNAIDLQYSRQTDDQVVSGNNSFAQGTNNKVSGNLSAAMGDTNTLTGNRNFAFGTENESNQNDTTHFGDSGKAVNPGQRTFASGCFDSSGDAQFSIYTLRNNTNDNTETKLFIDGASEEISLENYKSYFVTAEVVGTTTSGTSCAYKLEALIKQIADSTTATISGSVLKTVINEEDVNFDANMSIALNTGKLSITVTGLTFTNMHWFATVRLSECTMN